MKKFWFAICSMVLATGFMAACSEKKTDDTVTVTFIQNGTTVERVVKTGQALEDIPTLIEKEGYTVVWSVTDFSSVKNSMTVNAVETPNVYEISYDPNGGTLEKLTQSVTFDATFELATPTRTGAKFKWWYVKGDESKTAFTAEKYTIVGNLELVAYWVKADSGNEWSDNG